MKESKKKRQLSCLTAIEIKSLKKPGLYADGGGLYVQVSNSGTKSFLFRYYSPILKRRRKIGLGSTISVSLIEAREKAAIHRKAIDADKDPIIERDNDSTLEKNKTFKQCALEFIESQKSDWKNAKHCSQWYSTLETYAYPVVGEILVRYITKEHVLKILDPIWNSKRETADRVRNRMENIIDWATFHEFRTGANPARWKGYLENAYGKKSKKDVEHHSSLRYSGLGEFMKKLRLRTSISAKALEFGILTATRPGEVFGARWEEINFIENYWLIPKERMKAGVEHKIPLSPRAIEVLQQLHEFKLSEFIFSLQNGKHISGNTVLALAKEISGQDITVHGFRSTFKVWCSECTSYPNDVSEAAPAHTIKNKAEAAYNQTAYYPKRVPLMNAWADFCLNENYKQAEIIPIARNTHP
ncbi:MAG: hypothetical protein A4S09_02160 [Proteobacteria bacterium SG_bin7]|nr:MAG: hypothetical protein A4S09_02160 [Proteobacteria bacterium SG_bin7]